MKRHLLRTVAAVAASLGCLAAAPAALAKQGPGTDWLWLSASVDPATCVFTITVTWSGFSRGHYVEAFVTEGYAGDKLVPAAVKIGGQQSPLVVTLPALTPSATYTQYTPWAQLLNNKGEPIPASLDFSGSSGYLYCAPN